MEYRFAPAGGYEDVASGRVLLHRSGQPPFPAPLALEQFGRARELAPKKEGLVVYDPFCGGGTLLTVIGFLASAPVALLAGSDLDADALRTAEQNLALLSREGLLRRRQRLEALFSAYGKPSHRDAVESAERLAARLPAVPLPTRVFQADACAPPCPQALELRADIVVTDIPYGRLTPWQGEADDPLPAFAAQIRAAMAPQGVLALCASAAQALPPFPGWQRLQKQKIGKRRFALYRAD